MPLMNKKPMKPEDWITEFQSFVTTDEIQPPKELSSQIIDKVHADLNPGTWSVISKLAFIHVLVGGTTLLVCPQFGIGAFGGMGLMHLFMRFGTNVCTMACGAVFLGSSTLASTLLLRPEEVAVARRNKLLGTLLMSGISLVAFIVTGADIVANIASIWMLGATIGGIATMEIGWSLRSRFRRRVAFGI